MLWRYSVCYTQRISVKCLQPREVLCFPLRLELGVLPLELLRTADATTVTYQEVIAYRSDTIDKHC